MSLTVEDRLDIHEVIALRGQRLRPVRRVLALHVTNVIVCAEGDGARPGPRALR
jgi:hypothetical protein